MVIIIIIFSLPIVAGADQSRLSVWLVDGDLYCRGLLRFALTEQNFAHSCVLLVASLTRPWDVLDSLTRWSDVLSTHVQRLKLPMNVRKQQEDESMDIFLTTSFSNFSNFAKLIVTFHPATFHQAGCFFGSLLIYSIAHCHE